RARPSAGGRCHNLQVARPGHRRRRRGPSHGRTRPTAGRGRRHYLELTAMSSFVSAVVFALGVLTPQTAVSEPDPAVFERAYALAYNLDHNEAMELLKATAEAHPDRDRKSTRLNSSHVKISYAVFCLKKKKQHDIHIY